MNGKSSLKKRVFSLLGGITTHIISGSILYFYTFLPYRYSYLKRLNTSLKSASLSYIMPVSFMLMFIFFWFGAFLERKTNPRIALFVGNLIVVASVGLMWLSKSLAVDYILFAFYGIGIGVNHLACTRSLLHHFPSNSRQGLIIGVSMSGYALAAGLAVLVNVMINPEGARPSINFNGEGEYIYPIFITSRMKDFIILYICVLSILSAISVLCLCSYNRDKFELVDNGPILRKSNISEEAPEIPVDPLQKEEIKTVFKALPFYFMTVISILSTFGTFVCLFTFYEFGKANFADSIMLSYTPFGFIFSCGLGRIIWGVLYDKRRYTKNMYLILGSQILLCILFYFSVKWSWMYLVLLSLLGFTFGGILVIFPIYIAQYYGPEVGLEVYGFIAGGKAFSAIFSLTMVSILGLAKISFTASCLTMYIVGAVSNLVCILFIIFASDDLKLENKNNPLIYEDQYENDDEAENAEDTDE